MVLDARPIQDPDRSPITARYLRELLAAYDAAPLAGESFALVLQADLDDPTLQLTDLPVIGRRLLPPTRLLRGGALTVDPFLIRGASVGVAWRAERSGAAGAVHHAVAGAPPVLSRLPLVVTLLDTAPWELPAAFQRSAAARFGQRLRRALIRDAAAVLVATPAVATLARRLLRVPASRLHVVPLAPRPAFRAAEPAAEDAARLGLSGPYLAVFGRFDVRQDARTLFEALGRLAAERRPRGLARDAAWPPRVLLLEATPEDRAALARAADRAGVGESLTYAGPLPAGPVAGLVRGARAVVLPAISDAAGLTALDAIAAGTPVVATAIGALPETIGPAGILVEPGDAGRLAAAIRAAWADERIHAGLLEAVRDRQATGLRTWADVALDTRRAYAEAGIRPRPASGSGDRPSG